MTLHYVRVACRASTRPHSSRSCGQFLGYVPGPVHLSEVVQRAPDEPDGRIAIRCTRCGTWNLFDLQAPPRTEAP